ncbi:sulfatase [bacterium I07]|nr:sulfatase [bacterium I07]
MKLAGLGAAGSVAGLSGALSCAKTNKSSQKPNILWLSTEDISANLGCYGDPDAKTPILDALANRGVRYSHAFTVAGVCAPNRSAIITGVHQTALGTHHMRAGGEGVDRSNKPVIPAEIRCFSAYLRERGYYCTNNRKQDYQFTAPPDSWDESSGKAHWKNRPGPETPFFAVFNYGDTHEGTIRAEPERHARITARLQAAQKQDPAKMTTLPPYYPDTPVTRKQWSQYYELITGLDYWIADKLQELEDAGVAENTIVFFWSDHGVGLPRAKRWLYDSGVHVPLIVYAPDGLNPGGLKKPGSVDDRMISSIDLGPTVLNLAGIARPDYMQGQAFLGPELPSERKYVYGARDRMDERYDIIRMVRDKRYKYIKNYEPYKPYYQYIQTAERSPVMQEIRRVHALGLLPEAAQVFMADSKPAEELYDLKTDPHEYQNLANRPEHKKLLERMRKAHTDWVVETQDLGLIPEPELVVIEKEYGSRYAYFDKPENQRFYERVQQAAFKASQPRADDLQFLLASVKDSSPIIRYWAMVGLGNLGEGSNSVLTGLSLGVNDMSPTVRVAAAGAYGKLNRPEEAVPILIKELGSRHEWIRLMSATYLDELGESARPAIPQLREALKDRENKYVVRVANHALNGLLGTTNLVR